MKKIPTMKFPERSEPVCFNCKYVIWLVALGQGVRCGYYYENNLSNSGDIKTDAPLVPSVRHTCEHFEFKKKPNE
jgi:hypothetical protein